MCDRIKQDKLACTKFTMRVSEMTHSGNTKE
jgi:hypothetical protein